MLDTYRRKCIEATGRCLLIHYGQYETIIEQAFHLIHRVHPTIDTINERYQLITYTLNELIQRCQDKQSEKLIFIQCMIIIKVFVEQEKQIQLNDTNFKQLIDSLVSDDRENIQVFIPTSTHLKFRILYFNTKFSLYFQIFENLLTNSILYPDRLD